MLSPEQIASRRGKLTGSRIRPIVTGDAKGVYRLWQELTESPEFVPDDFSRRWPVQRGIRMESLNLDWYAGKGNRVSRYGEFVQHPDLPWAGVTLDAWDDDIKCPIEAKDCERGPIEVLIDYYQPQMQWQMACTGATECALSVSIAAAEPIVEYIPVDADYIAEMIARGRQFMQFVWDNLPPIVLPPVPVPLDKNKYYDMTGSNVWAEHAGIWLETLYAYKQHDDAAKILKSHTPDDAKKAFGHGIQITRNRAGHLSLRQEKSE